ncbi:MAG: bifunctional DNA primase/polymerase [Phycisphaerae bacterium]
MTALRDAAFDYCRAGLSVFATAAKKPLCRWGEYQKRLPTESELAAMPWARATGIALVLGPVSSNLCARDFDLMEAYKSWAGENPWLAGQCPTSKTARGRHVLFRATAPLKTIPFDDGELRGQGVYICLPPSRHESGIEYQWQNEPANLIADAPEVDAAYFMPAKSQKPILDNSDAINATMLHKTPNTMSYVTLPYVTGEPWAMLPLRPGQRNRILFEIVRRLKALPANQGREPESFEPELRAWHAAALPRIKTKDFACTLADFRRAWALCRKPAGASMAAALAATNIAEPLLPGNEQLNRLAVLCRALSLNPSREFFLSTRDACRLCGFSTPMAALRAFQKLAAMGWIDLVRRGTQGVTGRANRYRWAGAQPRGP